MTLEQIAWELDALGWSHVRHDARTLRCDHATAEGEVRVFVRVTEDWFIASVVPFLATSGDNSFELVRWLLRQNRDLYQAHFGTDEDGDVVLSVELPTESLDPEEVRGALGNLLEYAIAQRAVLRRAASA